MKKFKSIEGGEVVYFRAEEHMPLLLGRIVEIERSVKAGDKRAKTLYTIEVDSPYGVTNVYKIDSTKVVCEYV